VPRSRQITTSQALSPGSERSDCSNRQQSSALEQSSAQKGRTVRSFALPRLGRACRCSRDARRFGARTFPAETRCPGAGTPCVPGGAIAADEVEHVVIVRLMS
jgi:hypothetical protein